MSDSGAPKPGADYEHLLRRMRAEDEATAPSAPPLDIVLGHIDRARAKLRNRQLSVTALLLMGLVLAAASLVFHPIVGWICGHLSATDIAHGIAIPVLSMIGCTVLVTRSSAGAQMLLRALLWSLLLLGALATYAEPGVLPVLSVGGSLIAGSALLVWGDRGLEPERYAGSFVPAAHRGTLTFIMILAVADAQTLVSWAQASRWYYPLPGLMGLLSLIGIVGLYRLRGWGLLFNLVINLAVAGLALAGLLHLPGAVVVALTTTAAAQLGLAAPVLASIRAGRPVAIGPVWLARVLPRVIVLCVMSAVIVAHSTASPEHIATSCLH